MGERSEPGQSGAVDSRRFESVGRPDWFGYGAIALTATVAVVGATQRWGVGMSSDSVAYATIADALRDGRGPDALPTVWPPLYPVLLGLIRLTTGVGAMTAGRSLGALSAGCLVLLTAAAANRTIGSRGLRYAAVLIVAASPALLAQQTYLLSDAPFAVAVLAVLLLLARLVRAPTLGWLAASVAVTWVAFGFRYTGTYLVPVGVVVILAFLPRGWSRRCLWAAGYALAAAALPIAWGLRNRARDGSFLGPRLAADEGLRRNTVDTAASFGRALTGVDGAPKVVSAVIAVLVVLLAVAVAVMVMRRQSTDERSRNADRTIAVLAIFVLSQLLLTDISRSLVAFDRIDLRFIAPVISPAVLVGIALLDRLAAVGRSRVLRVGVTAVASAWVLATVLLGFRTLALTSRDGGQFNGADYAAVRADPALAAVPTDCHIYANVVAPLYWVGRDGENSPDRAGYQSRQASNDLDRFLSRTETESVCLVWIPKAWTQQSVYTPEDLAPIVHLEPVARSALVDVYRVTPNRNR